MSFYRTRILPWAMELILRRPEYETQRRDALGEARGRVLEIGFGFGASIAAYPAAPESIVELVGLEPNPGMTRRARSRVARAPFPVRIVRASAGALPFGDATFDTVATNWTLCSVPDPHRALLEIRRVLRPAGAFLFLEHGRAADPRLARRQEFFTPLQRILVGGCRLDLRVDDTIRRAGLRIETLDRYEATWGPRSLRQMYRGVARP